MTGPSLQTAAKLRLAAICSILVATVVTGLKFAAYWRRGSAALYSDVHDLKTRMAARAIFIEFHLVVPGSMTVPASHDICDRIEAALTQTVQGAHALIHVEPEREAKQTGAALVVS